MHAIEQSIEVNAPVRTVYNQWTQFEEFPEFMEGVEEVRQLDEQRLHWIATVGGKRYEWEAEIHEQVPDQRIAWRATSGKRHEGLVTFEKTSDEQTRVNVRLAFEPEGAIEKAGGALGVVTARVKGDLKRFKEFIEGRNRESGAWRGEIHGKEVSREIGGVPRSKRLFSDESGTGSTTASGKAGI